mmetsp:Transcript_12072/g.18139  ORF Transcript_12072/g.18139 Transcript_12072/m.18139 type:complete len:361 (+) Transcript_12072:43-1125(+)
MDDYLKRLSNIKKKKARISREEFDPVPWLAPKSVGAQTRSVVAANPPISLHWSQYHVEQRQWLPPGSTQFDELKKNEQKKNVPKLVPKIESKKRGQINYRGAKAICEALEIEPTASSLLETHFAHFAEQHKSRIQEHVASLREQKQYDATAQYSTNFLLQLLLAVLRRAGLNSESTCSKLTTLLTSRFQDRTLTSGLVSMIHAADRKWQKIEFKNIPQKKRKIRPKEAQTSSPLSSDDDKNIDDDSDSDSGAVLIRRPPPSLDQPSDTIGQSIAHLSHLAPDLRVAAVSSFGLQTTTKAKIILNQQPTSDLQAAAEAAASTATLNSSLDEQDERPRRKGPIIICGDDDDFSSSSSSSEVN